MNGDEAFQRVTSGLTVWALQCPEDAEQLSHRSVLSMLALIRAELTVRRIGWVWRRLEEKDEPMTDDFKALDRQWSERYHRDVSRYESRVASLESEVLIMREVLGELRMRLKGDDREKWKYMIALIDTALDGPDHK